jgi:hypothetical protein
VSVLPLIWSTPPDIARAAEVGSVSAADVPALVRLLFVREMRPPPSARAALASEPEAFAVTAAGSAQTTDTPASSNYPCL